MIRNILTHARPLSDIWYRTDFKFTVEGHPTTTFLIVLLFCSIRCRSQYTLAQFNSADGSDNSPVNSKTDLILRDAELRSLDVRIKRDVIG